MERKRINALIFAKKLPKRLIFYRAYNKNEEDEYSRSEYLKITSSKTPRGSPLNSSDRKCVLKENKQA